MQDRKAERLRSGRGRLIHLAAAGRHSAPAMDMSFANHALASEYWMERRGIMERQVDRIPEEIDRQTASLEPASMGSTIDELAPGQVRHLSFWTMGS
jgi:adenosylhomocysteinase